MLDLPSEICIRAKSRAYFFLAQTHKNNRANITKKTWKWTEQGSQKTSLNYPANEHVNTTHSSPTRIYRWKGLSRGKYVKTRTITNRIETTFYLRRFEQRKTVYRWLSIPLRVELVAFYFWTLHVTVIAWIWSSLRTWWFPLQDMQWSPKLATEETAFQSLRVVLCQLWGWERQGRLVEHVV